MRSPLSHTPYGDIVRALHRVEQAIYSIGLPTIDGGCLTAVDDLAHLITQEQLLASELELRVYPTRAGVSRHRQHKELHPGLPLNRLGLPGGRCG